MTGGDSVDDRADPTEGAGPVWEVAASGVIGARAASVVAAALRRAVAQRGRATLAVSGGSTPGPMFDALVGQDLPWGSVHVLQVDERVAPDGDPDRNLGDLAARLLDRVPVPTSRTHAAPVGGGDAAVAAAAYDATLRAAAGDPPVVDVVHLGLGDDGHTASLVPGDPVCDVSDRCVAATEPYGGRRRITMTRPVLRAARLQLWLVTGAGKRDAVEALRRRDPSIPASAVITSRAHVLLDEAADGRR